MIRVLQDWEEVGKSLRYLRDKKAGYHGDPVKNWDLALIAQMLEGLPTNARIIDMGCSGSPVLRFCSRLGFHNTIGVDFFSTLFVDRALQLYDFIKGGFKKPYSIRSRDLTKTGCKTGTFDAVTCLSVIEHGVPHEGFFKESARLLKKGGRLYVSTDYWETPIETDANFRMYRLPWRVFSKKDMSKFVELGEKYGFDVGSDKKIPDVKEKVVYWRGNRYTFIAFTFVKKKDI